MYDICSHLPHYSNTHITEGPDGELLAAVHLGPTGTDHKLIIENY